MASGWVVKSIDIYLENKETINPTIKIKTNPFLKTLLQQLSKPFLSFLPIKYPQ